MITHYGKTLKPAYTISNDTQILKYGIWVYILLLLFEGALRKWFLPSLATPLLVIRDPLALWLVLATWQRGLLPANFFLAGMTLIGVIGIITASLFGHGNLLVAIYGARIFLIQFPLILVIGRILDREDVINIGKFILWVSIPMAVLIALQFYSPQSTWVNRGVGGDMEGSGFSGAMGYFRPSGTFSFTNGTALFFGLVGSYIFFFWTNPSKINRVILLGATISLLVAIPFSISRTLFFQVLVSLLFTIISISRKPKYFANLVIACIGILILTVSLSQTPLFQTATEVFTARFENANEVEGGLEGVLIDRYLGGMVGALNTSSALPFFGYGLGMGTNVGSKLLTQELSFLISEGEWGRLIGELGAPLGIAAIMLRLGFCFKVALACYHRLALGDILPWLLLSFGLVIFPQGQWAQPTSLGFSILMGGILIASFNTPRKEIHKKMS